MPYTVGEMARKLQVAPSTLRYYDKEGLLPFVERSEGGIRIFKETDFEWLSIIEMLKENRYVHQRHQGFHRLVHRRRCHH